MTESQYDIIRYVAAHPCSTMDEIMKARGAEAKRIVMGLLNTRLIKKAPLGVIVTPKGLDALLAHVAGQGGDDAATRAVTSSNTTDERISLVLDGQKRWFKPHRIVGMSSTDAGPTLHLDRHANGKRILIEYSGFPLKPDSLFPRSVDLRKIAKIDAMSLVEKDGKTYMLVQSKRRYAGKFLVLDKTNAMTNELRLSDFRD
jgi:hypothetical protein